MIGGAFVQAEVVSLDDLERYYIEHVLDATNGNISQAARLLGLHRSSLQRRMRKLGLRPPPGAI